MVLYNIFFFSKKFVRNFFFLLFQIDLKLIKLKKKKITYRLEKTFKKNLTNSVNITFSNLIITFDESMPSFVRSS